MPEGLPTYQFLPYARSALGASARESAGGRLRARLRVHVERTGLGGPAPVATADGVDVAVALHGPGDVVGIEAAQVIRTEPRAEDWGFEPNYLAAVEFDAPELPWLLTPQQPDGEGHLRPWIVLVVVEDRPGVLTSAPGCNLSVLQAPLGELPRLEESWAWAHVQLLADTADPAALRALLADPARSAVTLSRLVCPRALVPRTRYVACVVPSFRAGVQAGLGAEPEPSDAPAWGDPSPSPVRLPVYHSWRFRTGEVGDFEAMARLLHPVEVAEGLGRRSMAVVPSELPGGTGTAAVVVPLRSALVTPGDDGTWPSVVGVDAAAAEAVEAGLASAVNAAAERVRAGEALDAVGPPLYGEWHAQRRTVDRTVAPLRGWLDGLNLDPEARVIAGAGASVVRDDQEELMARAWDQVKAVDEANERLRWLQFSLVTNRKITERRFEPRSAAALARVAGPTASRLRMAAPAGGETTVAARIATSPLPDAVVEHAFARVTVRTARRARTETEAGALRLVTRLLQGEAALAPSDVELAPRGVEDGRVIREVLSGLGSMEQVVPRTSATVVQTLDAIAELPALVEALTLDRQGGPEASPTPEQEAQGGGRTIDVDLPVERVAGTARVRIDRTGVAVGGVAGVDATRRVGSVLSSSATTWLAQAGGALRSQVTLSDTAQERVSGFRARFEGAGRVFGTVDTESLLAERVGLGKLAPAFDLARIEAEVSARFDEAVGELRDRVITDADSPPAATLPALGATELHQGVAAAIAPLRTFGLLAAASVRVDDTSPLVRRSLRRLLHPVMVAPSFPEPAVERLARRSRDHVLANADLLEPNGITLLVTNPRFVEAFLVGVNHEMARELLFRGYPTDRRGTCFRTFWPRLDGGADAAPISDWDDGPLGHHADDDALANVVVVLRGDLLRRYPNTVVTARKGTTGRAPDGEATFEPDPDEPAPRPALFAGRLEPDVTYVGLQLSVTEAQQPGWFILLTQPPTEPRFGLDALPPGSAPRPPRGWNDLTWGHVVTDAGHLSVARTTVAPERPGAWSWGRDAATTAAILLQQPFRLAMPAHQYLPRGGHS